MEEKPTTRRNFLKQSSQIAAGVLTLGGLWETITQVRFSDSGFLYKRSIDDPVEFNIKNLDDTVSEYSISKKGYLDIVNTKRGSISQRHPENYVDWEPIKVIIEKVWKNSNADPVEYIKNTMDFIALNTDYQKDRQKPFSTDFTKHPLETIIDKGGDCEDLAVLAASFFAYAGIRTGIVNSPGHAAVAISLDEVNHKGDYPNIVKIAELFDSSKKIDSEKYFDRDNIQPHSVVMIPEGMTVSEAYRKWEWKKWNNKNLYRTGIDQHFITEDSNTSFIFKSGPNYLTAEERRILSVPEALKLKKKRKKEHSEIAEEWHRKQGYQVEIFRTDEQGNIIQPKGLKYFYLEATADNKWKMYDKLPLEMTFFPLPGQTHNLFK